MTQIKNVIARDGPLLGKDWTFSIPLRRRARDADYQSTSAIRYGEWWPVPVLCLFYAGMPPALTVHFLSLGLTQIKNVIARDGPLLGKDWTFSIPLTRRARDADYQSTSAIRYGSGGRCQSFVYSMLECHRH
ncbi:hypothetical protein CDAR_587671 [Caerostris darwini]|uniref:Uncharacterized protein n=1 Tax=Caerostris darwini TaxID=1538125 RepID=A0AAV4SKJ0_9ARAC|nr:hypothetical protein CDAR_587671 [Caerostris darwini]